MILESLQWWSWSLILFVFTSVLGIVAVIGGVGGGVLFVPFISALFPFHLDFVRGAGLLVALTGAIAAAPHLIRTGLASLRMALPFALTSAIGSMAGAMVGLSVGATMVRFFLGVALFGVVLLMLLSRERFGRRIVMADPLAAALKLGGTVVETRGEDPVPWNVRRTPLGLAVFLAIGFLAGMFGLGAGWANVPALHLLLGAPLKVAIATSGLILAFTDTAAVWVYLHNGAILPLVAVPSILGMMIGTRIGAQLLPRVKASLVRRIVVGILLVAATRLVLDGI